MERMDGCLNAASAEVELTRELPVGLVAIAVLVIARDILKALEHLEQKRIVHGDLKPENILYRKTEGPEEEWTYKLSDFDGAVKLNSDGVGSKLSTMGTLAYASPERLEENDEYPFAGDIWSLGVTLHILRYARFPFPSWRTDFQLQRSILQGKLDLSTPETDDPVEAVLQGIIVDMLTLDPAQRLRATALLKTLESVFGAPSDVAGSCGTSSSCSSMIGDWIDDSGFLTEVLC
jgi:serine/threonine protein kinase